MKTKECTELAEKKRIFAFDFDGVIAHYDGNYKTNTAGKPNIKVVEAMKILKQRGHRILISSSRGNEFLKKYCERYGIPVDHINENPDHKEGNKGKPVASVYLDDRAVTYTGQDTKEIVKLLENFKAYWKN
jgi:hydroxymethylpyrimidine pyrophosphatase-like HAD family hydrolase